MGGRIRVASQEGSGSSFAVELAAARGLRPLSRGYTRADLQQMTRVLVIDDEAPIRLLCRVNLEAEGMDVLEAGDGQNGLELARAEHPGRGAPRRDDAGSRRLGRGRRSCSTTIDTDEIPIVFLTARAEYRDRARGLDIGGVDYITKPFNPVELAPLVRRLLERIESGERDALRSEKIAELRTLVDETA